MTITDPTEVATVTVYTKEHCPACRATRRRLEALGVGFVEQPIGDDAEALKRRFGARSAPVVTVVTPNSTSAWDGYRPELIDAIPLS